MKTFILLLFTLVIQGHLSAVWVVNRSSITLYEEPKEFSEIEDVIGYATLVEIENEKEGWVHLKVPKTGWHGWAQKKDLLDVAENPEKTANAYVGYNGAYLFPEAGTSCGYYCEVPFMTPLQIIEQLPQEFNRWVKVKLLDGLEAFVQKAQLNFKSKILTLEEMIEFSKIFLGKKYIYGGTTSLGFDCSGFTQMLFQQCGIKLPRNSGAQILDPSFIEVPPMQAQAGDLIFFKRENGRVRHVGLMLNHHEFIHSFPLDHSCIMINCIYEPRWVNGEYSHSIVVKRRNKD